MIDKRISYAFGGTGGRTGGTGGRGNGGPPGGGDRQMTYSAPAPSRGPVTTAKAPPSILSRPAAPKDERKNPFEETGQTKIEQEKIAKNVQELQDKAKEFKEKYPLQEDEVDDPEFYVDLDKYMEDKDLYSSGDVKEKIGPKIDIGFQEALRKQKIARDLKTKQQDPTYGQFFAPKPVVEKPKKGLWGTVGNIALGILAPQLLGPKLGQLWSGYNRAKNLSKFASTFTGEDYVGDLTKKLRSNISTSNLKDLIGKRSTIDTTTDTRDDRFGQRDGDGRQVIAAPKADVVTESVQKFTPSKEQLTELQKRQAILQRYADKGGLNERGQNTLLQMNQFLEKYLVSVAHGGFIDKPLMGRSRDI